MKLMPLTLSLVLLAIAAGASAATLDVPKKYLSSVKTAEEEGALMYKLDQAVWVASDAAQLVEGFSGNPLIHGWLTEETPDGIRITFYGGNGNDRLALYRALVSPNGMMAERPVKLGDGEPLSEFELSQAMARETAAAIPIEQCAEAYNTIALLRTEKKKRWWSFYIMPATKKQGEIMAGIAYRVDVDWQGKKILGHRGFSKSCIAIPADPPEEGAESAGAYLTHLLDPVPTPVHVFLSLQHHEMIAVLTTMNSLGWIVKDGHIMPLDMKQSDE